MIGSFAQRRFGGMMPIVGKGFFAGARDEEEAKSSEIQQGFALYFVYGYRDNAGRRVIDMFREYGLKLDREQTRVLGALEAEGSLAGPGAQQLQLYGSARVVLQ